MYAIHTSARRRTRPSEGPERSQQLQILPSLTVRQFFSGVAYLSCCANIGGRLVFRMCQHFYRVGSNIFPCAKRFLHPPKIFDAPRFWHPPKIEGAYVFVSAKVFGCANVFVYILWHLYFCVFFCILI
jgi:hypothetical protein